MWLLVFVIFVFLYIQTFLVMNNRSQIYFIYMFKLYLLVYYVSWFVVYPLHILRLVEYSTQVLSLCINIQCIYLLYVIKFYTYSVIKQRKYSILLKGVGVNMIVESTVLLAVNNSAEYTFHVTRVTKRKIIDVGNHLYKSTLSPV